MNIGSATQSTQISTAMRQAASAENKPYEREPDGDRDDTLLKVQAVPAKPIRSVSSGCGSRTGTQNSRPPWARRKAKRTASPQSSSISHRRRGMTVRPMPAHCAQVGCSRCGKRSFAMPELWRNPETFPPLNTFLGGLICGLEPAVRRLGNTSSHAAKCSKQQARHDVRPPAPRIASLNGS